MKSSWTEAWTSVKSGAMHVWPALTNLPHTTRSAADLRSAEASTITGDFPPSSSVTEARCSAAFAITFFPMRVLPVKKKWSNGSSSRASATGTPPPTSATSRSSKVERIISHHFGDVRRLLRRPEIAVFPAAIADTSGAITRLNG